MDIEILFAILIGAIILAIAYRVGALDAWIYGAPRIWKKEAEPGEGAFVEFTMGGERTQGIVENIQLEGDNFRMKLEEYDEEFVIPSKYLTVNKAAVGTRDPTTPLLITDYDILTGKPGPIALNAESAGAYLLDVAHADIEHYKAENAMLRTSSDESISKWIAIVMKLKKAFIISQPAQGPKGGSGGGYEEEET